MQITGAAVLITGANRGIGRAFVEGFVAAGAGKIYAAARDPRTIKAHPRVSPIRLDITDPTQVTAAATACADVSVLINNAGVMKRNPLLQAPDMIGARLEMETNYFGTLAMCRAFAPILARQGGGVLVNILSPASWVTWARAGGYSASKRAQLALTLDTRIELRAQRTLVIGVYPGFVDTDMMAEFPGEKAPPEEVVAATLAGIAVGEEEVIIGERASHVRVLMLEDPAALEAEAQRIWDARPGVQTDRS